MKKNRKKPIENTRNVWTRPLILSLAFHLMLFSMFFFVPESMPTRRLNGPTVYEVDLVQLPSKPVKTIANPPAAAPEKRIVDAGSAKAVPSRLISPPAQKEKPVVIGKRVVERETPKKKPEIKVEKPKVNASKLIDQAITKIEKKVKTAEKKKDHLATALSKIQSQVDQSEKEPSRGDLFETGMAIRLYQMEVAERIKQNWSYPVAINNPGEVQGIEAVVVVTVREDGSIVQSTVKKKSSSTLFDASVLRAIERSDPLPPFPEGYRKSTDDIEIRFNLSEMETS